MNKLITDEVALEAKVEEERPADSEPGALGEAETVEATEECAKCGGILDVSELLPLTQVECPYCHDAISVLQRFHHFQILEELGRGGMGAVYRAFDTTLQREVALKLLLRKKDLEGQRSLLEHEAQITASINHPHVVRVFSTGHEQGLHFIAMEVLAKETLQQLIKTRGRLTEFEVLRVGVQVAEGLRAAYAVGLLHRDIKPGNILFYDTSVAKVADFGLALDATEAAKSGREVFGTAYYIAPERILAGAEDVRSDIYSLGATLFHALAGRPPFEGKSASIVAQKHISTVALSIQTFAPDISMETARILKRTLEPNPADRYADYDQLIEHLKYAQNVLAQRSTAQRPRVGDQWEQNIWSGITVAMLVAGLVMGGWWFTHSDPAPPRNAERAPVSTPPVFPSHRLVVQPARTEAIARPERAERAEMASVKPAGELRAPENPANTVPGLEYKYYEGNFDGLPDFSALTPAKVGTVAFPALNVATRKMDFAIEYTGFLTVPTDGDYVFIAGSDDGSRISIGSTVVADNNGAHPFSEVEGTIGLKAGTHAFTVAYFQRDLLSGLTVSYSGPGIPRRDILPAAFSHVVARETSKAMQAATVPLPVTPPFPAGARSPSLLTH